jgi:hypothetical protein
MLFPIEPKIEIGKPAVKLLIDGWTTHPRPDPLRQVEHSVGIAAGGGRSRLREIFTSRPRGAGRGGRGGAFRRGRGNRA